MTVTKLLAVSIALMISAAASSSFLVLRMRPVGSRSVSVASPRTSGITATPVSNPDRPSASFGNRMSAIATIISGCPCCAKSAAFQLSISTGCCHDGRGWPRR